MKKYLVLQVSIIHVYEGKDKYEGKYNTFHKVILALKYAACRIRTLRLENAVEKLFGHRNTDKALFDSINKIDINKF